MVHAGVAPRQRNYPTPGFAGYNVAWSPFFADKFAVVGAANVRHESNPQLTFSMAWLVMDVSMFLD